MGSDILTLRLVSSRKYCGASVLSATWKILDSRVSSPHREPYEDAVHFRLGLFS